ncbi:putative GTP-binding protein EngB [Alphaproteobacteria bacterium]|nr:putative GTP-binding protein EngB [Alphaproteobacteria bacterium]
MQAIESSFLTSAPDLAHLPPAGGPEVAFVGRSNVGKSSLINALCGKPLARVSGTPGRTRMLNFFACEGGFTLVDLPGYGFAKIGKAAAAVWTELVRGYLTGRPCLRRVFLLIDARHGLKPSDLDFMAMLDKSAVLYVPTLTKSDKISSAELAEVSRRTMAELSGHAAAADRVLATSSEKGWGVEELRAELATAVS